jgi:hypothetical protein
MISISRCLTTRSFRKWKFEQEFILVKQDKVKTGSEERKRETFPVPTQEMGAKTPNGGPHLFVLYWRAGGIQVVKGTGSGWLRWLLKQGGVILAHPNQSQQV